VSVKRYARTATYLNHGQGLQMKRDKTMERAISTLGLSLTALGILIPHCFPLAFVGVLLTAIGFGMIGGGGGGDDKSKP